MNVSEFMVFVWPWVIVILQWVFIFMILKWWKRSLEGWKDSLNLTDKLFTILDDIVKKIEITHVKDKDKTPVQDSSV